MKPASIDLRQRLVDAYARKEGTIRELAVRFSVSYASAQRWLSRLKKTGSVAPSPNPTGKANGIITEDDRELLLRWYSETPDATYTEMAERFTRETGRYVARSTMGASVKRLGITRKKRASNPRNVSPKP
jgi:transposase